jgi:putative ABC transport system permease protein
MTFVSLVVHNVWVKKLRFALTALAVAIGVLAVVALGVVTHSLESSQLAIVQTGKADFTIAQKGVYDLLSSSVDEARIARIAAYPGVASVVGVLIGTTRLNAANPLFLEIGINPGQLSGFGVTVVSGRPFKAAATDELMLGWRAAENLNVHVGDSIRLDHTLYHVVGIYSTGQALGDAGAMLPLRWFQAYQRQPGQLTLLFVRVTPGTNVAALQAKIDRDNPQLTTIRTAAEFGRADRSLAIIKAADRGSTVLAVIIGSVVVLSAMSITFIERMREFGIQLAIGWSRFRVMAMILGEAAVYGLIGAAAGLGLAVLTVRLIQRLPVLQGVLHPDFTASVFARALYTAAAMSFLGGFYPAVRAAVIKPLEALRLE